MFLVESVTFDEIVHGSARIDAYLISRRLVGQQLPALQQLTFDSYFDPTVRVSEIGPGEYVVNGYFSGLSGPDQTVRRSYDCRLLRSNDSGWQLIDLQFDGLAEAPE